MQPYRILHLQLAEGRPTGRFDDHRLEPSAAQLLYNIVIASGPGGKRYFDCLRIGWCGDEMEVTPYATVRDGFGFQQMATIDGPEALACYHALFPPHADPELPLVVTVSIEEAPSRH